MGKLRTISFFFLFVVLLVAYYFGYSLFKFFLKTFYYTK